MRALLLIFSAALLVAADKPRIVSTSLCGDSYVLSMAAPDDIAALSWQVDDAVSGASKNLRAKPKAWDDPERLLALRPTLVVFGPGEGRTAKPFLDTAGIDHVTLIWGEDFDAVYTNQAALADAGHSPFAAPRTPIASTRLSVSVLYLSRAGGSAGPGTYIDAAIRAAGGVNIITTPGWHTPDLETILPLTPDLIITSFFDSGYASTNENGMRHSVIKAKLSEAASVNIPGKLWPCAGPGLYAATDLIRGAIEELSDE